MSTAAFVHARARQELPRHPTPSRLALALAAGCLLTLTTPPLRAQTPVLPTGLSVAAGQAQLSTVGNRMTVTNSPQAILNWNSFSIGSSSSVYFQQASATSQVLNRVTGNEASSILGSLGSNGRVWLLNPNGVLFGAGARVDVAGLVSSTLRLTDADWLGARLRLTDGRPGAEVLNQGELRSTFGGTVALIGGHVRNEGLVQAPGGQIILAAGQSVELVDTGAPHLGVRITAADGQARNLGSLQAAGGRIDIHAAAVNQQGIVSADALGTGPGGEIWIKASQDIELAAASRTSADGGSGGSVHIASEAGRSSVLGDVSAVGSQDRGGQIVVLGREVGLMDGSQLDASGTLGGGQVIAGGGERGQDLRYAHAQALYFGPQARITADARSQGDGGRIVLWSDQSTRAYGALSAQGGPLGGDGGFIETSGGWLDARPGRVDTRAAHGRAGNWLLDPFDIFISDETFDAGFDPNFTANADNASISSSTLVDALNNGTNITIDTGAAGSGTGSGTITVLDANIISSVAAPGSLSLVADGGINITNATIGTSNGPMAISMRAGRGGTGLISISASTLSTTGSTFNSTAPTTGADLLLGGFAPGITPTGDTFTGAVSAGDGAGVVLSNTTLASGSGRLTIQGTHTTNGFGVSIEQQSSLSGADIDIRGDAPGGVGVLMIGSTRIDTPHTLSVMGRGLNLGVLIQDIVNLSVTPAAADGSAGILVQGRTLAGNGGTGVTLNNTLTSSLPTLTARNGASITLEGANVAGDFSPALAITGNAGLGPVVDATGAGAVTLRTFDTGAALSLDQTSIVGGSGLTTLRAGSVSLSGVSTVSAAGPVVIAGDVIILGAQSLVSSSSSGDAIVLSGQGTAAISQFSNLAGAEALAAPNGRWIVHADSPTSSLWSPNGLPNDFTRHGGAFGDWAADTGNGFVFSAAQSASFTAAVADRPYDGTLAVPLSNLSASSSLGDVGVLRGSTTARYADPNAGTEKPATFDSAPTFDFSDSAGKPVFGYSVVGSLSGNVTPAAISSNATAANKVYDGGTSAALILGPLTGLVGNETVFVAGTASFASKDVGNSKPVTATYTLLDGSNGGLARNYQLSVSPTTQGLAANITPAELQYVAKPELRSTGQLLDDLTGTVTGLVGGDTLATATQGQAVFRTSATLNSQAGIYGVTGDGLSASNYVFSQAPGNARALTLVDTASPATVLGREVPVENPTARKTSQSSSPRQQADAGFADTTVVRDNERNVAPNGHFGTVPLASLSSADLEGLLAGRRLFMQNLLSDAVQQLERNPSLADLRECRSLDEARQGDCLVTPALKMRWTQIERARASAAQAPALASPDAAPAPPPVAAPAATATPVTPTAPVAAAAAAPAVVVAEAPPALPVARRKVQSAALPQIERKIALVVGVSRYADTSIPLLGNAVNDAQAVAKVFETRLGYEPVVIENATKPALVAALNRLALTLGPRDSVLIYYAGHGEQVESTQLGYWLLADSVAQQPETWLSNADISRLIAQIDASQVALVSDSCYSGSLAAEERIRAVATAMDPKVVLGRKSVVVMSSGGNEPVFDDGKNGHSPFAWHFMNTLDQVSNWQAGSHVFERVRFAVSRALPQRPQYSASKVAGHQAGGDYLFEQRQLEARK